MYPYQLLQVPPYCVRGTQSVRFPLPAGGT
jgi:hypothetical protein